jgi:outer membrane protein TolC
VSAQIITLDSCKILTLENNKRIVEAGLKVAESEQVKKNAFTNYFPQISAGFVAIKASDYLFQEEIPQMNLPVYDGNPANLLNPTQFAYFPGMELKLLDYANLGYVAAVEPLYMGGRVRNGNKLASVSEDIQALGLTLSIEEALLKTEEIYWTGISLHEKMKTINAYENLLDTMYNDVSAAYEAGLIQKTDLLKVELKQNELQAKKTSLQHGIEMISMALCQHIGITYSPEIVFSEPDLPKQDLKNYLQNPDSAIVYRPEYKMLENAVHAEVLQKRMARGEFMPQLAVGVSGLYYDMIDNQNTNAVLFATLNIPISAWWGGSHKIKEHQIKVNLAKNKLTETNELMVLEIHKAQRELTESVTQVSLAEKSLEQVKEFFKETKDNFEAGIVSTSDMLEAQAMYQEAEDNLTDAQCMSQIKLAYYLKSVSNYK